MRVDLHIHSDVSSCSHYDRNDLLEDIVSRGPCAFTVTDHGSVECCRWLTEKLDKRTSLLFGTEVTSHEGDFLVFSADPSYFDSVSLYVKSVSEIPRKPDMAVIWAHPRVGAERGWKAPSPTNPISKHVLGHIDGIEQVNGNMLAMATLGFLADDYFAALGEMAQRGGLALTGGSDAHRRNEFFRAWTNFPDGADSPARLIEAIKDRATEPGVDDRYGEIKGLECLACLSI